ncbi:hypothetical protein ARMGADRAFT_750530 [Armillaria gallica]|uniref:Uncharacterized protein n=1 Tax=Armillaria gallica TaxID=47427 RepID=A0A2H3DYB2_ARMGA|nr:hypothetical protein ARMGADRAFT_750530 [Armillaria gallica]
MKFGTIGYGVTANIATFHDAFSGKFFAAARGSIPRIRMSKGQGIYVKKSIFILSVVDRFRSQESAVQVQEELSLTFGDRKEPPKIFPRRENQRHEHGCSPSLCLIFFVHASDYQPQVGSLDLAILLHLKSGTVVVFEQTRHLGFGDATKFSTQVVSLA